METKNRTRKRTCLDNLGIMVINGSENKELNSEIIKWKWQPLPMLRAWSISLCFQQKREKLIRLSEIPSDSIPLLL